MSVRVTLNCQVNPDRVNALIPFLKQNLPNVRGFNGNMKVSVFFDDVSNRMLLEEEWMSVEHHQEYLKFIDGNGVLKELGSFLLASPDIKYFSRLSI